MAGLVLAVALAGCTATSESGSDSGSGVPGMPVPAPGLDGGVSTDGGVVTEDGGAGAESADRDIVSQGYLQVTVEDPLAAADDTVRLVERAGGRIDGRTEQPDVDGQGGSAQLVVRIPAERLTATLEDIKDLGEVEEVSITATDVTAQTQDLEARIQALRASVGRLLELLASATSTTDVIAIETALSERQSDLESLEAQQRGLSDQVDLATVSVGFGSEEAAPPDDPDGFLGGIVVGWNALVGFLVAALVAFGIALPWFVAAGVLALIVLAIVRSVRRSRRPAPSASSDSQAPAAPPPSSAPAQRGAGSGTGSDPESGTDP